MAVLPFAVKGNLDALYAEVALDNFTTELIKSNSYKIVEHPQLDKAMRQLKFQSGSVIDESGVMEVGKVAGAEIVVIGEITALTGQIIVNVRGININSGVIEIADKGIINSQDQLLIAIERIAKKFFGSENFAVQNYANQSLAMDFSINTEYTKYATKEFDKRFIVKHFQTRWKIDPKDTPKVYEVYKKYLYRGIPFSVAGGITLLTGVIMMIVGFCDMASVGNIVSMGVGTVIFISGVPLLIVGLVNLGMASKIKKIHALATGEKTFTPRISTTGGLNGENRQLEIALGYRF